MARTADDTLLMLEYIEMDTKVAEYLDKYHADSNDDKRVEVADYKNDRRIFFTVGELRSARNLMIEKQESELHVNKN